MRALLLSAYHAQSHAHWVAGLRSNLADIDWTVLTLPPRHFNWRLRGNSLSWAFSEREILTQHYDVLVVTSMCDLVGLRGFLPALAGIPCLVYCHENQFAYPASGAQRGVLENQITTLYTALAADRLVFNSHFNRDTFITGARDLLKKMPDYVPLVQISDRLEKSRVVPVGIDLPVVERRGGGSRLWLVWNHRWEYDKGPELLLALVSACAEAGLAIDFSIVGQQFRRQPPAFAAIRERILSAESLGLKHWGFIEDEEAYRQLLAEADVVLSTAQHDFQGLAVLQAVAAGCTPLAPDAVVYPEWFARDFLYADGTDSERTASALQQLQRLLARKNNASLPPADVSGFGWQRLAPRYREILRGLVDSR